MKKIIILTVVILISCLFLASAQIQRGNILMGGNLTNINLGLNDPKIFSVDITPKVAWFVHDNVAFGGYVNLGIQTAKGSSTTTSYGAGLLGRYYTGSDVSVLKHGRLFGEGTAGIGGVNVSKGGGNTNGLNLSAGPGFAYFITPNIGLETLLKYNGLVGFGSEPYQSNLNLSFGLQIFLSGSYAAKKVKNDMN
jgi:hypothetical protein